ncbi:MAG: sigma-54-dependent transcriptional regulator [Verrucomicrobiales bacterium]
MSEPSENTILLVDPDLDYLEWATKHLQGEGLKILRTDRADKALKVIEKAPVNLVIADHQLEPFDGLELLSKTRASSPGTLVILTAGFPTTNQIIESTQKGAHDVLRKESLPFELRHVVESALRSIEQRSQAISPAPLAERPTGKVAIIGVSRALQDVLKVVGRVAHSDAPVLVTGESGTGKELVARAVHDYSPRRNNELLTINCGAIPDNLLESELFGHEKGSFTGAMARRQGRFEHAHNGTLFLDEVGDLPASVQVKLLRVLQDGTFSRVGSNEVLKTDVRIVAATNKDLAAEVTAGNFREDLYYRLNVIEVRLPALRERPEDIPLLAEFFLANIARRSGMARLQLSGEAVERLQQYNWPGNVRELENTITRACALASNELLLPEDIPFGRTPKADAASLGELFDQLIVSAQKEGRDAIDFTITKLVEHALEQSSGDHKEAARVLGTSLNSLRKKLPGA